VMAPDCAESTTMRRMSMSTLFPPAMYIKLP
jgi:hypothetical protein